MIRLVKVVEVRPLAGGKLSLRFSDSSAGRYDFTEMLSEGGPMIEPLREPAYFRRVFLSNGVPAWSNGFELDAIALHMEMAKRGALKAPMAAD
jgi:hypothetical protein